MKSLVRISWGIFGGLSLITGVWYANNECSDYLLKFFEKPKLPLTPLEEKVDISSLSEVPKELVEEEKKNNMILIPADEKYVPYHYFIGKYEVSNAEYKEFVDATGAPPSIYWEDGELAKEKEKLPVRGISAWYAVLYTKWKGYRVPTEREWLKAALYDPKKKKFQRYTYGNKLDVNKAIYGRPDDAEPEPVDSLPEGASPYGCHHMAGNVWEIVTGSFMNFQDKLFKYYVPESFQLPIELVGGSFHDIWFFPSEETIFTPCCVGIRLAKSVEKRYTLENFPKEYYLKGNISEKFMDNTDLLIFNTLISSAEAEKTILTNNNKTLVIKLEKFNDLKYNEKIQDYKFAIERIYRGSIKREEARLIFIVSKY